MNAQQGGNYRTYVCRQCGGNVLQDMYARCSARHASHINSLIVEQTTFKALALFLLLHVPPAVRLKNSAFIRTAAYSCVSFITINTECTV